MNAGVFPFRIVIPLLVLGSFVLISSSVLAQPPYQGPLEKRELINKRQDEVKERIATKNAQLKEKRIERIKKVFDKILSRFEAALKRLDKIVGKIERRIAKLKEKGVDTSAAESALAACSSKKTLAESAILDAKSKVASIDPSSSTKDAVKTAVDALHSTKKEIKTYHKCLSEVHRLLKVAKGKEGTGSAQ